MTYEQWKKSLVDGDKTGLQEVSVGDTIKFMDITKEWTKSKGVKGSVIEKKDYTINGTTYKVDGKQIVLHPTKQEKEVATILAEKYGKIVEFVPQVMYPQGIQTPDYMINGERFDLKSPTGNGKNLLYGMLAKKKKQSPNFIFDVTECPLSEEDIEKQIYELYTSRHTKFVQKIVVIKNEKILKVYGRK